MSSSCQAALYGVQGWGTSFLKFLGQLLYVACSLLVLVGAFVAHSWLVVDNWWRLQLQAPCFLPSWDTRRRALSSLSTVTALACPSHVRFVMGTLPQGGVSSNTHSLLGAWRTFVFLHVMWSLLRNGTIPSPGDDNPRPLTAEIFCLLWNLILVLGSQHILLGSVLCSWEWDQLKSPTLGWTGSSWDVESAKDVKWVCTCASSCHCAVDLPLLPSWCRMLILSGCNFTVSFPPLTLDVSC